MTSSRLYIAARDPRDGGGVQSMAKVVYRAAERIGYNPCIVCNMLNSSTQARLTHPLRAVQLDPAQNIQHTNVDGLEVKGIPLILPEIEFTHYVLNISGWRKAIEDGDIFFAVGGTNQCNLPFIKQNISFGSWTATLLWEDRVDRLQSAPLIERVRDRISRPILEHIEKKAFNNADPAIVLSEYTAERVRERYRIEADEVISYPIDTEQFSAEPTGKEPTSEGPVALFVGRFNDPRKNISMLVEAFAKVREEIPDAELWLIGDEPNEYIRNSISSHGLDESVVCHDKIPNRDLPKYYRGADLLAIPSNQEGLAIVGLEAMACGTPVVSTRCGGPEQYIISDETGYLVPKDDTVTMAKQIIELLADSDYQQRLSRNARNLIIEEYNAARIRNQFQTILKRLRETTSG